MRKLSFAIIILTAISFWIRNCSSAEKQKETLKEELSREILQQLNQKYYDARVKGFTSFIGATHDIVEFKENGDVHLRLSKDNQLFDITQKNSSIDYVI